ncbi:MAG: ABC transporter permease, partial [Cyanobacteria bacterium P01_H01_bin.162]
MGYLLNNPSEVGWLLWQHLQMTSITLLIAIAVAVPIALLITRYRWLSVPVMGTLGVIYTIPSLALIIFLVPVFGLNATSVIVAMVLYTQVILVRNLTVGLSSIDPAVLEASRGMGMSPWQRWWWIQVPLVLPVFVAGVRIAAVVGGAVGPQGAPVDSGGRGPRQFFGLKKKRIGKICGGSNTV